MDVLLKAARTGHSAAPIAPVTDVVLARIAAGAGRATKADVSRDVGQLAAHGQAPDEWARVLERALADLVAEGLAEEVGSRITATQLGLRHAAEFLGVDDETLAAWPDVKSGVLVAKALGIDRYTPAQAKALAKFDGLAGAVVAQAFKLKIKGNCTASRLRAALSVVALERAFGNQIRVGFGGKAGMSPKASRMLAAQLTRRQKDPGTDARLVEVLAAEAVGIKKADHKSLQTAVLRKWLGCPEQAKPKKPRVKSPGPAMVAQGALPLDAPVPRPAAALPSAEVREPPRLIPMPAATQRPTFDGFIAGVKAASHTRATGWAGNRKAYIAHVWQEVQASHPAWGITEIEFKAMLAEAHRMGRIALSTADLKDPAALRDVQDSALSYRNAVFHFVRLED